MLYLANYEIMILKLRVKAYFYDILAYGKKINATYKYILIFPLKIQDVRVILTPILNIIKILVTFSKFLIIMLDNMYHVIMSIITIMIMGRTLNMKLLGQVGR